MYDNNKIDQNIKFKKKIIILKKIITGTIGLILCVLPVDYV